MTDLVNSRCRDTRVSKSLPREDRRGAATIARSSQRPQPHPELSVHVYKRCIGRIYTQPELQLVCPINMCFPGIYRSLFVTAPFLRPWL
jgi:hypothetical protein